MTSEPGLIDTAERIAAALADRGTGSIVIGAAALAAHRYVRFTEDLDLGVSVPIGDLAGIVELLRKEGYHATLREPDGDDPLGGVIDVDGPFGVVQIVNFGDRFPAVIENAMVEATEPVRPGGSLRVVPLPHLVALKLYAGGMKSSADIVELLRRNPSVDRAGIRALCRRYRLKGLERLIREADG